MTKPLFPISSLDEAMACLQHWLDEERYRQDPYAEEVTIEELRPFIKEIWEAAQEQAIKEQKKSLGNSSGGRRYRDPKRR